VKGVSWATVIVTLIALAVIMRFAPGVFAATGGKAHQVQHAG
jgi:hypothetical protein